MTTEDGVCEFAGVFDALTFSTELVLCALYACARIRLTDTRFADLAIWTLGAVFDAVPIERTAGFIGCTLFVGAGVGCAFSRDTQFTLWAVAGVTAFGGTEFV